MNQDLRNICALTLVLFGGMLGATPLSKAPPNVIEPMNISAPITPRAQHAALLGVALAGERMVAVGERGIVLFSDDKGVSWQQSQVPVGVTLTVVRFADALHGWAAGHNGILLKTIDAGATWTRVLDGNDVIALYQQQAKVLGEKEDNEQAQRATRQAAQLASDGPDKPWLDMNIDANGELWLVGAYGLALHSRDGKLWEPWSAHLDNPNDLHLYAIKTQGNEIVIAGEQGLLLRSMDDGATFQRLNSPYKGSFFVLELHDGEIVVAGLRGYAFRSVDHGGHFEPVILSAPVSVTASLRLQTGDVVLADQAGTLYRLAGDRLLKLDASAGSSPSAFVESADGTLVSVGRLGPSNISATLRP
ncbi:YCF48-related protein [Pseudomonas sp.]|uniref:WD40/YVTN/BNR-like repeat-containing protein n=1 Tax=Pseudomonas sp. TaxID=306 RepID=UPI002611496D|nr:YCF48-related protein [Pseudomonas sp.]